MKYFLTRFSIKCGDDATKQTAREILAAVAGECGYETFMDTEEGVDGYVQVDFYDEQMLQAVLGDFPVEDVEIDFATEEVEDQDWNATWEQQEGFQPIVVDGKMMIYDALHTDASDLEIMTSQVPDMKTVAIEARNAFGTGTHETTRMMISSLMAMPLEGCRVLDCGCGTGILGIAALKCGAKEVVAYDIDEWSVENTRHNAELNGVGESISVLEGDSRVLESVEGEFDVVVANIFREILLADMDKFKAKMKKGACLLLSGFYEEDVPLLTDKAESLGLHIIKKVEAEEWRHLVVKK